MKYKEAKDIYHEMFAIANVIAESLVDPNAHYRIPNGVTRIESWDRVNKKPSEYYFSDPFNLAVVKMNLLNIPEPYTLFATIKYKGVYVHLLRHDNVVSVGKLYGYYQDDGEFVLASEFWDELHKWEQNTKIEINFEERSNN